MVRSWKLRSCHLEVYTTYAGESFPNFTVVSAWSFCQPFLKKNPKPSGVIRETSQSCTAGPGLPCSVEASLFLLSFCWNAVLRRELGLPLIFLNLHLAYPRRFFLSSVSIEGWVRPCTHCFMVLRLRLMLVTAGPGPSLSHGQGC